MISLNIIIYSVVSFDDTLLTTTRPNDFRLNVVPNTMESFIFVTFR